jgi:hypothetical protein
MAGGLPMAHPPVDPTPPSRPSRPGRLASNPSRRRSAAAAASHGQLGVRRPITASMSADRREQAIAALAHLLIVSLERQLRQPDPDAQGRGRVAGSGSEQEEQP